MTALANGITNNRKIQVVRGYLEGAAASWFDEQRNLQNDALQDWTNNNRDHTNFKLCFEQQFRTQQKLDKWQDELETLQQTGSVEQYTNRFNELIRKVDPDGVYPLSYKKRIYRRGLNPALRKWTTFQDENTFQELVDAAKLSEEAEKESTPKPSHQNLAQNSSDMVTLASAIQQIALRLDKMENRPPQQPRIVINNISHLLVTTVEKLDIPLELVIAPSTQKISDKMQAKIVITGETNQGKTKIKVTMFKTIPTTITSQPQTIPIQQMLRLF